MEMDLYFISTAARLLQMHPQTLRKYERLGLVSPSRTIGSMRVYSRDELDRLRLIKHLVDEAGHQPRRRAATAVDCRIGAAASPAAEPGPGSRRCAATIAPS